MISARKSHCETGYETSFQHLTMAASSVDLLDPVKANGTRFSNLIGHKVLINALVFDDGSNDKRIVDLQHVNDFIL